MNIQIIFAFFPKIHKKFFEKKCNFFDNFFSGNVFKGLAASGSWGCFDEFNRLVPEVLSVCTVQFKAVCDAVRARVKRFILQGDVFKFSKNNFQKIIFKK